MDIKYVCNEMIRIAKNAGNLIMDRSSIEVKQKGDVANIVTSMDVKSQNYILSELKDLVQGAKVIAEENNVHEFDNGYVWVVDPIDATTNYAYDCKFSCISIALLFEGTGFIGVVYNPYLDETFVGVKNHGSYLNGKRIYVNERELNSSLVVVGTAPYAKEKSNITFSNLKKIFDHARDIRRTGSAVLDLCYVACGRFDAFYEASLAPWDYSAAQTIIKEANGMIDAIAPDVWGYEKSIGVIAGNSNNFDDLKNLVKI